MHPSTETVPVAIWQAFSVTLYGLLAALSDLLTAARRLSMTEVKDFAASQACILYETIVRVGTEAFYYDPSQKQRQAAAARLREAFKEPSGQPPSSVASCDSALKQLLSPAASSYVQELESRGTPTEPPVIEVSNQRIVTRLDEIEMLPSMSGTVCAVAPVQFPVSYCSMAVHVSQGSATGFSEIDYAGLDDSEFDDRGPLEVAGPRRRAVREWIRSKMQRRGGRNSVIRRKVQNLVGAMKMSIRRPGRW